MKKSAPMNAAREGAGARGGKRSGIDTEALRAACAAAVEIRSTRVVAREIGHSPAGLRYFVAGGKPSPRTARKLLVWYVANAATLARSPADAAGAALALLADLLPDAAAPAARRMILAAARAACVESGVPPPDWIRRHEMNPRHAHSMDRDPMIVLSGEGPEITATNFWESEYDREGLFFLSIRAGVARLLVPDALRDAVNEFRTGREVVISRGPRPDVGVRDAVEIMFDDGSRSPFALYIMPEQTHGLAAGPELRRCTVWVRGEGGQSVKALDLPAFYRTSRRLPDRSPWRERK